MKHATIDDLFEINTLIGNIRTMKNINEKSQGHFYYKGKNVLHFHIENSIIYADIGNTRIIVGNNVDCFNRIIDNTKEYINEIDKLQYNKQG